MSTKSISGVGSEFVGGYMESARKSNQNGVTKALVERALPMGIAVLVLGGTLAAISHIQRKEHAPVSQVQQASVSVQLRK